MAQSVSYTRLGWLAALCLSVSALTGCANGLPPSAEVERMDADPLEPFNRSMYKFNYVLDRGILKPVVTVYRTVLPEPGREMVSNFLNNLYSPVVFANSVLQTDPQNSFATFWRFMLNTTFGFGGLFDFASDVGLKNRSADFGQTLAMYGINSGPYIYLPIIGPCNARDAAGRVVDTFMNPVTYAEDAVTYSVWGAMVVDTRSNNDKLINDIYSTSLDPYTTFRSGYTQKRVSDVRRGTAARNEAWKKAGFKD